MELLIGTTLIRSFLHRQKMREQTYITLTTPFHSKIFLVQQSNCYYFVVRHLMVVQI